MPKAKVTIVVTQRERFSGSRESLESVYEHTKLPFELIYVDGNSPAHIRSCLEAEAGNRGFVLVQTDYYLFPNQARNIGLARVDTEFAVFLDNDIVVSPGWLEPLLACAEETGAAAVAPLICIGRPLHENIHNGGGRTFVTEEREGAILTRSFRNKDTHGGTRYEGKVSLLGDGIHRGRWDYVEFHCMLVRSEVIACTGPLDEGLMSTREHIDFCMMVTRCGGKVYMEPGSIVTYLPELPERSDLEFFMLRWSDKWHYASMERFGRKWEFDEVKYKEPGYRRERAYLNPFLNKLPIVARSNILKKIFRLALLFLDRRFISLLMFRNERRQERLRKGSGGGVRVVSPL
jgi:GT2 family glycosyltransferase